MTARRFTHLTLERCAQTADVCIAAGRPEVIPGIIRDATPPEDAGRLLAKRTIYVESFTPEQRKSRALEERVTERFSFASLSGEREIAR